MKPYYETENGKLYHGDCRHILPFLPTAGLVLTDPKYGINENAHRNNSRNKLTKTNDYTDMDYNDKERMSDEQMIIIKESGKNCIIFGGNYYGSILGDTRCYIVWDKDNGNNDFADCELAWTNFNTSTRLVKYRWHGMLQENSGKNKEKRIYPTQKPVGLFKWILQKYANPDFLICDPCCGSGTTAIACEELGLKWQMIDMSEKACEIAAKRIEAETKQNRLPGF